MKLIIADESELSERGTIHISNREMKTLVALLEKWGIDFEAFQQYVQRTPGTRRALANRYGSKSKKVARSASR